MKLKELIDIQSSGALKIDRDSISASGVLVGGVFITHEQCSLLLQRLGWTKISDKPYEVIDKTNKFINGIKKYIDDPYVLDTTEVEFQDFRHNESLTYYERITLVCPDKFNLTIINGMSGVGGRYGVYSSENNFKRPVKGCRSLKELGTWIEDTCINGDIA